ncbi:hypothetical protein LUZ60_015177 [Juncus effusus]|nr:hypothetical protein LUZ60_015177 [Juncus effusus]
MSIKLGLFETDPFVQSSLIAFYSSFSLHSLALQLFDRLPEPNLVSYTSAMDAYLRSDQFELAISLFLNMLHSGISPDSFSLVTILSACAETGDLHFGRAIHSYALKTGLELTPFLATALISMYSKCSSISSAISLFHSLPTYTKSTQVYNAMIHGLALHGLGLHAQQLFDEIISSGTHQPNSITFVGLLSSFAQNGLVKQGKYYFNCMVTKYGIAPNIKHYGCMVDLLGRAGLLNEAFDLVNRMQIKPNYVIWGSLLRSCSAHGDLPMAERVMERIKKSGEKIEYPIGETSHFAILSNMYRKAGVFDKFPWTRSMVWEKQKCRSWILINGERFEFGLGFVGSRCTEWTKIMEILDELDWNMGKENEERKREDHSEKLAVCFGLIRVKKDSKEPIRVFKNLRVCKDCHDWMKFVSVNFGREIIMRDCNRFHRFVGGICTCKDYW